MFKQKILSVLLALGVVALVPSVALAQTTSNDLLYEDTSLTWDTDWDYGDYGDYSDLYDYSYEINDLAGFGSVLAVFSTFFAIWGLVMLPLGLGVYVYTSIAYMTIAKKLNHPHPWYAWVPVLSSIQRFQLAEMSAWFVLLLLVPGVNLVISIIALMKICERRGLDKLLGLLALIPAAALVLAGVLAWKKDKETPTE